VQLVQIPKVLFAVQRSDMQIQNALANGCQKQVRNTAQKEVRNNKTLP
jgi:hypothetical protein